MTDDIPNPKTYQSALSALDRSAEESTILRKLHQDLAERIHQIKAPDQALLVGVAGSQGSGKSTHSNLLRLLLEEAYGLKTCILSIDDVYLSRAERQKLAERIHPLLKTRGVPGTHDIALAEATFEALKAATTHTHVPLPRFDKATDDPVAPSSWPKVRGPVDVILFEGWCIAAPPQSASELAEPINTLESQEDPDGAWRQYVNEKLSGPYQRLFAQLDLLIMLAAPSFEVVFSWRQKQEHKLRQSTQAGAGPNLMDDKALKRFIMHYERITRAMLKQLPARADCVISLSDEQQPQNVSWKSATSGA